MQMEGITIVFICLGDSHPSLVNYRKFGNKYWDDGKGNKSKVGYWFLYYYRKQFVRVHKILQILPNTEKPTEMKHWESDRQILCLSPQLKEFTWHEWITDIGIGSPYALDNYGSTNSNSWTVQELEKRSFNFKRFKSILEMESKIESTLESKIESTLESTLESEDLSEEPEHSEEGEESSVDEDILLVEQINKRIYHKTMETVHLLREEYASLSDKRITELNHSIEVLVNQRDQELNHKESILNGNHDEDIVKRETELKVHKFIMEYM
jgi:hypothetical protein